MGCTKFLIFLLFITFGSGNDTVKIDSDWWKNAVIYQIYPKSFQSTTGNGIGDLKGITSRLEYIKDLGVDAVWLSPINPSKSNADAGYDISDFRGINPDFGTFDDFKELVNKTHSLGMKLILDFVPNHSSDQHDWFINSENGEEPWKDYYVWKDPGPTKIGTNEPQPPNNWMSIMSGTAWQYSEKRKQFYLHQFLKQQPDLNYNNPKVVQEMQDILKFWLDYGVDGFRMDAVFTIWEDLSFRDEPAWNPGQVVTDYSQLKHIYTSEQSGTYDVLASFRKVLDNYTQSHGGRERIMFTESYANDTETLKRYYGTPTNPIAHFPFNFLLLQNMKPYHLGVDWSFWINKWFKKNPLNQYWPNWVMGNHDKHRISSRFTREHTDIITMALMSLPGTYISYFGDELALEDSFVRRDQAQDTKGILAPPDQFPYKSRDFGRGPMPWNNSDNKGFSINTPWLPLTSDHHVTVEAQTSTKKSHLQLFRSLVKMRKLDTFAKGDMIVGTVNSSTPEVLIITRSLVDHPTTITAVNFGKYPIAIDLMKYRPSLPDKLYVYAASLNTPVVPEPIVTINPIVLQPISGMVLSTASIS